MTKLARIREDGVTVDVDRATYQALMAKTREDATAPDWLVRSKASAAAEPTKIDVHALFFGQPSA